MAEELAAEVKSPDELAADLRGYEEQRQQVEQLLLADPENAELAEMHASLGEVIALTRDLLADAKAAADANADAAAAGPSSSSGAAAAAAEAGPSGSGAAAAAGALPPGGVAEHLKRAQQRSALLGQAPPSWAVGGACLAYYAADGQWYPGRVTGVTEDGKFVITYDGYGNTEELPAASVRPPAGDDAADGAAAGGSGAGSGAASAGAAAGGYRGVAAPKRRRVEDDPAAPAEVPKWLEIKPEDDEKTVERKRKLIKAHKSKARFQAMDMQQKEKQGSWQAFLKGKGSKAKAGFMTGKKKQSMFAAPEDERGKVGVVGSGRGMTDFKRAGRHEFSVDGGA